MYSDDGQEIAAKNFYRPCNPEIFAKYEKQFSQVNLFTLKDTFGDWSSAHQKHFSDDGTFVQITRR